MNIANLQSEFDKLYKRFGTKEAFYLWAAHKTVTIPFADTVGMPPTYESFDVVNYATMTSGIRLGKTREEDIMTFRIFVPFWGTLEKADVTDNILPEQRELHEIYHNNLAQSIE